MSAKILGPEVGFPDLIDHEIMEKQIRDSELRKQGKIKYHPLRPSASGQCKRKLALELQEYQGIKLYNKPILEPNIIRLFELGHKVEDSVIKSLMNIGGFDVKYRQQALTIFKLNNGDLIEGSTDLVLWSDLYRCIADVKSKKDKWSVAFKTSWDDTLDKFSKFRSLHTITPTAFYAEDLEALIEELSGDFMIDNLLQLNLYANTSFVKERNIDFASLFYYNKNDSRLFELRFKPSEKVFKKIEEKFNEVVRFVKLGKVEKMECEFPIGSLRHSVCDCHKISSYLPDNPSTYYFNTLPSKTWPTDSKKFKSSKILEEAYSVYRDGQDTIKETAKAEEKILDIILKEKKNKVRFSDGTIYEAKYLKSPYPHFELRRSKL